MRGFHYVYILASESDPRRHYTGMTTNPRRRLKQHNAGLCRTTCSHGPWRFETVVAFRSREKALAFERYLKSHSGRAFATKHF